MKDKIKEANLSMIVSKTLNGLNVNALKYLLPLWVAPITGVTLRFAFGTIAFWLIGIFAKPDDSTTRDKLYLFVVGAVGIYGFMLLYLLGISMTTPVSGIIFSSMQPIWVFIISAIFIHEKVTGKKLLGIMLGFVAAILCIVTQPSDELASNAFLGNILNFFSSIFYAIYLIFSSSVLKRVSNLTFLQYTFLGGCCASLIVNCFVGFDVPLFTAAFQWKPMLILLFVLIFPTTISYLLIPIGLKYLSPTSVAIYGYLILVVATITSLILGQDRFSWWQTLSIVLMCISVYWVEVAEKKTETKTRLK